MIRHRIELSVLRSLHWTERCSRCRSVSSGYTSTKERSIKVTLRQIFHSSSNADSLVAYFNWWSDNQVNAPFYGAYMAGLALADGDHVTASDAGTDSYAQYVIYRKGKPFKVVLINTDYYSGRGERTSATFKLTGLTKQMKLKAIRMSAPSSEVYTSRAQTKPALEPTIGGMDPNTSNAG